ncbi:MAG: hypothetical protein Q4C36_06945, partial [Coriobacteriia bacterium]|nr:hypothetical protein [Coriobacteriia bacterium]
SLFAAKQLGRSPGCSYKGEIEDFATAGLWPAYLLPHTTAGTPGTPARILACGVGVADLG